MPRRGRADGSRFLAANYVAGAIGNSLHIRSTPNSSPCASLKAIIGSVGGRAPPRTKPRHCASSRSLASPHATRSRRSRSSRRRNSSSRAEHPRQPRPDAPRSAAPQDATLTATPNATRAVAASSRASTAILLARSFDSGEYFFDAPIALIRPCDESRRGATVSEHRSVERARRSRYALPRRLECSGELRRQGSARIHRDVSGI